MEKKYKFLIAFFSLVTIVSLAGFYSSYWSKFPRFGEFKNLIHIHFLAFTFWLILIIIQPILVMRKKFKIHRQLGRFSYLLAPILVLTIILLTKEKFIREFAESESSAAMTAFIAFVDIFSFSTFYLIAMFKKSNVRWHSIYHRGNFNCFKSWIVSDSQSNKSWLRFVDSGSDSIFSSGNYFNH